MRTRGRQAKKRIRSMGLATSPPPPPPFTPGSLTGIAPSIDVAVQRSSNKLWQDAGKTVQATADTDPVRVATCPYTGVDYAAPSNSARPLLTDKGGGKWTLKFDGVDDAMFATFVYSQPFAFALGVKDNAASNGLIAGPSFLGLIDHPSLTQLRCYTGTSLTYTQGTTLIGAFATNIAIFNGATSSLYRDADLTSGDAGTGAPVSVALGGPNGAGGFANMELAAAITINAAVTGTDLTNLQAYVTNLY